MPVGMFAGLCIGMALGQGGDDGEDGDGKDDSGSGDSGSDAPGNDTGDDS